MKIKHLVLISAVLCACSKKNDLVLPEVPNPVKESRNYINLVQLAENNDYTVIKDSIWADQISHTLVLKTLTGRPNLILPEFEELIYQGAAFKSGSIGKDLRPEPLNEYQAKPIKISTAFSGASKVSFSIEKPSYKATNESLQTFLKSIQGESGSSLFYFTNSRFSHLNELKLLFGQDVNIETLFHVKKNEAELSAARKNRNGILFTATQKNFSFDMNLNADVFEGSVDKAKLKANEVSYVASISYGRTGHLAIEADASDETLNKIINMVKSNESLDAAEKAILEKASVYAFIRGYSASAAADVQNATGLSKISKFFAMVKNEGSFKAANPGSPLFYILRGATEHSVKSSGPDNFRLNIVRK